MDIIRYKSEGIRERKDKELKEIELAKQEAILTYIAACTYPEVFEDDEEMEEEI